ncbi:MAG: type II secretion system protein [Planctomycetes bacterium]|nr:type II secretion system protein [Planctomycetota bacterium]
MKRKKYGFTIVELLTVITIIALLVAVLVPSLAMVRRVAKETQQECQLTAIDLALTAFQTDYGDYPPSDANSISDYCGAQKLAEALLGWDLMGFHPDSAWRADGKDKNNGDETYDPDKPTPMRDDDGDGIPDTLSERRELYLELETTNAFKLRDLYGAPTTPLALDTFVICDVFSTKRVVLTNGKVVKAGTPILYYKANTLSKSLNDTTNWSNLIYNAEDNLEIIKLRKLPKYTEEHKLVEPNPDADPVGSGDPGAYFYSTEYKVVDPKIDPAITKWPHRPNSYILISAGADGEYGTRDDICNF